MALQRACELKGETDAEIICVLHYPPYNSYLDESEFTKLIEKYKIKKVVFGHLHGKNKYQNGVQELNVLSFFIQKFLLLFLYRQNVLFR